MDATAPSPRSPAAPSLPVRILEPLGFFLAAVYWYGVTALLGLAVLLPLVTGWEPTVITSGSMEPRIASGDIVLLEDPVPGEVAAGDVVAFTTPARPGELVVHRVLAVGPDGVLTTRGDANRVADSTPVAPDAVVGVGRGLVPYIGTPAVWFRERDLLSLTTWGVLTLAAYVYLRSLSRRPAPGSAPHPLPGAGRVAAPAGHSQSAAAEPGRRLLLPSRRPILVSAALLVGAVVVLSGTLAGFSDQTANGGNTFTAAPAFGTPPSHVKLLGTRACGGASNVITVPAAGVPIGNTVVVRVVVVRAGDTASITVSDSRGNAYVLDVDVVNPGRARTVVLRSTITTALTSGNTITVTLADPGRAQAVAVDEFTDVATVLPVDATAAGAAKSTTPTASVTTVTPGALLVGIVGNQGNHSHTEMNGWTSLTPVVSGNCGGGFADNYAAYRVAPLPGIHTYQTTLGANDEWAEAIAAYRP